jgi:hypothetical protein
VSKNGEQLYNHDRARVKQISLSVFTDINYPQYKRSFERRGKISVPLYRDRHINIYRSKLHTLHPP